MIDGHSFGWRDTSWLDARTASLPLHLTPRSATLARVVIDGSYLRALVGALSPGLRSGWLR